MNTEEENNQLKDVEFYAATANAWYNSALEHDKSLLTLSTGGIGFLITILTTVGASSVFQLVLYAIAILSFCICLITILKIFKENQTHLQNIIQKTAQANDPNLKKLDTIASYSFLAGIIVSATIGICSAIKTFDKEKEMANDNSNKVSESSNSVRGFAQDSFNGAMNLQTITKSFNGALNIQPTAQANQSASPATQNPSTTTTSSTTASPSATSNP